MIRKTRYTLALWYPNKPGRWDTWDSRVPPTEENLRKFIAAHPKPLHGAAVYKLSGECVVSWVKPS